jgi:hypothetical protein
LGILAVALVAVLLHALERQMRFEAGFVDATVFQVGLNFRSSFSFPALRVLVVSSTGVELWHERERACEVSADWQSVGALRIKSEPDAWTGGAADQLVVPMNGNDVEFAVFKGKRFGGAWMDAYDLHKVVATLESFRAGPAA